VDEVGVGAWAGPVIAAAVILLPEQLVEGLNDSKLLSAKRRSELFALISGRAGGIGVGRAEVEEVDRLNVYWAAMLARRRAVEALGMRPGHVLIDGKRRITGLDIAQTPIIEGDRRSVSIAAASVVAKVIRDRVMEEYAEHSPGYGFERHKGYGTAEHLVALTRIGLLPIHRRSFAPVAALGDRQLAFHLTAVQPARNAG
jgi:ribonuclease HII